MDEKIENYKNPKIPELPTNNIKAKDELEKTKKELEELKKYIIKKYPFTLSLSILPPQSIDLFIEEEEVPKETEKHIHLYMLIPEKHYKDIPKIKEDIIRKIEEKKDRKIWLQIKTPVDVFEACLDSRFELVNAIGLSFPIYDTGFLDALRVAEIHKALVLKKFDKYVVSYVIAGSLVRGEATKTSDVDVFIIINDTDVKRMSRIELKERLRAQIYQMVSEASFLAGAKNKLEPQIYLLTEFWDSVKDAVPVMFTFIRDGFPLHDRGTFLPWKALLRMGKLKPSPEAINMFMSSGDQGTKRAHRALMDILVHDIYWSALTPSQGILMLYGLAPPTPKQTVKEMERVFLKKEKILEKKYIDTLAEVVKLYKDYEHGRLKEISGKEIDRLLKNTEEYLERLKELRKEIEKKAEERTIENLYEQVFELLEKIFKKKTKKALLEEFEKEFVKKGVFTARQLEALNKIIKAKSEIKKKNIGFQKVDEIRKESANLINGLQTYIQIKDIEENKNKKMLLEYSKSEQKETAELILTGENLFVIEKENVLKISNKVEKSNMEEVIEELEKNKEKRITDLNYTQIKLLNQYYGNFTIKLIR